MAGFKAGYAMHLLVYWRLSDKIAAYLYLCNVLTQVICVCVSLCTTGRVVDEMQVIILGCLP